MERLTQLVQTLQQRQVRIIGVDGTYGAGKTTIADHLATQLRCPCFHLDDFLIKGQGIFLNSLRYELLSATLRHQPGPFVVEGLCLLDVLRRISLFPGFLIFVEPEKRHTHTHKSDHLQAEIQRYFGSYAPRSRADTVLSLEDLAMSSQFDVDIAYIKSKTIVSVTLAIGGLLQTVVGALLLNAGLNDQGTATLKIMGGEVSASGLGGIVLCVSAMWAYFAYLSRPKFSSRSEIRNTTNADGSSEAYEFRSSTQIAIEPEAPIAPNVPARSAVSG